ncbi:uncharacterized protein LOC124816231 [Hydra vulgaris]|uniref:uncharacterized protein LOC124816231 n=1 Tax=Hydra vulgaris TaxID=6087 RepID=UPI0032E9F45C
MRLNQFMVNEIQTNLESCLEKNDFNASASLLQFSKNICIKFNGHKNLETQITSVYENLKVSVISKLKNLSESCERYFEERFLTNDDLVIINNCLQLLENAKHINLLCEHITKEEIDKYCETFLSKIIKFFEYLNNEVNHLFKNEKFKEMETISNQMQLVRRIRCVENRTAEAYHSTTQNITGYMRSLSTDTEILLKNVNNGAVDYNKIFANLKTLKDAEWLNKHKCGHYENIIKNIQNNLTEQASNLYTELVDTNLDLENYLELEKADKILKQLDRFKKFHVSIPDIQNYFDQSFEYFNSSVEKTFKDVKNIFFLEKHCLNRLRQKKTKLITIKNEYQQMQPSNLYLKSEKFSSIEKVDEKILELSNNINKATKDMEKLILKQKQYATIINENSNSENKSKKFLHSYNFMSIEDVFIKEKDNEKSILEIKSTTEQARNQIIYLENIKSNLKNISILDQHGINESIKTEIVKAFIQLDKYAENVKFCQLYCDYTKKKIKELDDFEKNIMECIENYKFNDVAMNLSEIDEKVLKSHTIYKIKNNLDNSLKKIIAETKQHLRALGNSLDKSAVNEIVKQLSRLNNAKKNLYSNLFLIEKFKVNSYLDEDTQVELNNFLNFIHEIISKKILKYMEKIEIDIAKNCFYEAEIKREHLCNIYNSLENFYQSDDISNKIDVMQEKIEENLCTITEKYEKMQIHDYFQNSPKAIFDELEKLVNHASNMNYVKLLNKIKEAIRTEMVSVFQGVKAAKPKEREKSMELIKSTIILLPDCVKLWVEPEREKLIKYLEQEYKTYHDDFIRIQSTSDVKVIYEFMEKCIHNEMEGFIRAINIVVNNKVEQCNQSLAKYLDENDVYKALLVFKKILDFIQQLGETFVEIKGIFSITESTLSNKFNNFCSTFLDISSIQDINKTVKSFENLNYFNELRSLNHQCYPKLTSLTNLIDDTLLGLGKLYKNIVHFFSEYQLKYHNSLNELNVPRIKDSMTICKKWSSLLDAAIHFSKINPDDDFVKENLSSIESCHRYDQMKDTLSMKLKTSKQQIHNIESFKTCNNERDIFYQEFLKQISFLYNSKDLKNHINNKIFDPSSYDNEVFPFLTNFFNKVLESTKNIFSEGTFNINLRDLDLFRLNLENLKSFDVHAKKVGLNFNLSSRLQEITEKLKSTLKFFFTMVDKSESDVNEKAKWLIKIKTLAINLPEYSDSINESLDNIFKMYNNQYGKSCKIEMAKLSIALEQDPSGVGFYILSEHSVFKGQVISIFNQTTCYHGIDYVLNKLHGDNINPESIQRLKDIYDSYLGVYQHTVKKYIVNLNEKNDLNALVRSIKHYGDKMAEDVFEKKIWDEQDRINLTKLIANIFALWTLQNAEYYNEMKGIENQKSYLLTPHPSQVISIFRILGIGYIELKQVKSLSETFKSVVYNEKQLVNNDKLQNNLVQVGTGEGKSLILAVVSCVLSLIGFDVSCACYSEYLSSRDYKSFLPLFTSLDLTTHIHYATFNAICEGVINQNCNIRSRVADLVNNKLDENVFSNKKSTRPMILLIDEVDVFFNKDFYGSLYTPLARIKNPSIADLTHYIWSHRKEKLTLKQIQSTLEYQNCCNYLKEWQFLVIEAVKDMLADVQDFKHDYIIKNDKLAYKEQDGISYDVIYCYKTLFAYYFEHDEGRISTESLNDVISIGIRCGSYSFAEIPNNFHYITGVSGTLQTLSKSEKQIIESYGIKKFTYIPSMFGDNKRRFAKEADIFIENTDDYFPKLNEHIEHSSTIKNELRRPVLVFFTTKTSLMEFYNSNKLTLNKEYIQIITEEISESPKEKEMLIKRATVLGQITFLTRAFGRGTDFVCSDQNVIVNGGVHVIQTFFSEELSEEVQIQGRTARQGKDGSCSMVLRDSDLEKYLGVDYLNIIYKLRNEKVFYDTLNSKRNQLYDSTYLNISVLVKEAKKEHLLEENFVKNLNNNKIDEIKAFLGERNIGSTNTVITSRTICLIDATGSMGDLLNKAKVTVGTMFERAAAILNENSIAADSFQMQFAVYRDYDCLSDGILQYSPWETKPENLRLFMDKISAYGGGDYEEAIEIGLWHVDRENKESAVNQVILIGDAPAKSKTQINEYQNVKGEIYWQKTDFKVPTFYKIEVEKLKKIGIVVHTFYLHDGAKSNFQEIAKETGGLCEPLNIDSLDGANTLTDIVTRRILGNVGQLSGKGNELVNAYNKRFVKSYK